MGETLGGRGLLQVGLVKWLRVPNKTKHEDRKNTKDHEEMAEKQSDSGLPPSAEGKGKEVLLGTLNS